MSHRRSPDAEQLVETVQLSPIFGVHANAERPSKTSRNGLSCKHHGKRLENAL